MDDINHSVAHKHDVTLVFDTERDLQTFTAFIEIINEAINNGKNNLEGIEFVEWYETDGRFQQSLEINVQVAPPKETEL